MFTHLGPVQKSVLILTVGLYLLALISPAILFERVPPLIGWQVLHTGWLGILTLDFAWFANPFYLLSVKAYFKSNNALSMFLITFSILIGMLSLVADQWWFNEGSGTRIVDLGIAFYFWMGSFGILFVGALISGLIKHKVSKKT